MGQRVVHVQAADLRELLVPHRVLLGKQETKELEEDKGTIRPYILTTSHNKKPTTKISASLVTSNPPISSQRLHRQLNSVKTLTYSGLFRSLLHHCIFYFCHIQDECRHGAKYLADGEHGIVGFSHCVINESGHQFSDLV